MMPDIAAKEALLKKSEKNVKIIKSAYRRQTFRQEEQSALSSTLTFSTLSSP
jgi:hypothetical protein